MTATERRPSTSGRYSVFPRILAACIVTRRPFSQFYLNAAESLAQSDARRIHPLRVSSSAPLGRRPRDVRSSSNRRHDGAISYGRDVPQRTPMPNGPPCPEGRHGSAQIDGRGRESPWSKGTSRRSLSYPRRHIREARTRSREEHAAHGSGDQLSSNRDSSLSGR